METLGHSTLTMTQENACAHVMQTTPKAAADRKGDALGMDGLGEDEETAPGHPPSG